MLSLAKLPPEVAPLVGNAIHVDLDLSQLPLTPLLIHLDVHLDLSSTSDSLLRTSRISL